MVFLASIAIMIIWEGGPTQIHTLILQNRHACFFFKIFGGDILSFLEKYNLESSIQKWGYSWKPNK